MRAMGMFPYFQDQIPGPSTDGTLASVPTGRDVTIPLPDEVASTPPKNRNTIVKGTIGHTDTVYCHQVQYGVFAGDA